jgi:tetratricopeptide (TPR) repeat protein
MCYSKSSSLLRNALHLNNQATVQIADGEYDGAVSTLSAALVQLKQSIRYYESSSGDSTENDSSSNNHGKCLLRFLMEDDSPEVTLKEASLEDEDEWYIYRYPVQIKDAAADLKNHSDALSLISFAGIYNLGLCHHLQAISPTLTGDCSSRQLRLQRATAFYEQAQKLLCSNQDNTSFFDPDMIHSLVIANNLGHAYYFLGNETTGKMCFQRLLNAILYISHNSNGSEDMIASDKNRWDGFMVNIMQLLIGKKISHAAAA